MATTRLMFVASSSSSSPFGFQHVKLMRPKVTISNQRRFDGNTRPPSRQPIPASPKALLLAPASESKTLILHNLKLLTRTNPWTFYIEMFVEKVIVDCRFFTLFAVGGSMVGSVLCFVEGCSLVVQSYLHYFHALAQRSDQGHIMQLLIESIDMFLIGAAMLTFGMSLYVMFVGSNRDVEGFPSWLRVNSVMQAKSRIGHAVMLLLQVGVLDKFKNIPVLTGFDLACFSAAVFASSATTFLLSRLVFAHNTTTHTC